MSSTALPSSSVTPDQTFGDPHLHTDGDVLALAFAPDGTLWSVEEPGVLRHWNAAGKQLAWHSLSDLETLWEFSRDARVVASGSTELTVWDTSSGQVLAGVPQGSWVTALAFHPDSAFIATGHDDGLICLWDAAGHNLVREFRLHNDAISALAFNSDGSRLASAAEDKTIAVWDGDSGELLRTLTGHTDRIPALAWRPAAKDGLLVSAGWDTTARVWDSRTGEPVILLNDHAAQVTAVRFSGDGSLLATADSAMHVRVWDFAAPKLAHLLKGPQAEIRCLAFGPKNKLLAANGDRLIHLWDPAGGQATTGAAPRVACAPSLALTPDGKRLATNGGGLAPRLFNIAARHTLNLTRDDAAIHALACSPDGRWLAGAAEKTVRLWDAATGEFKKALDGPDEIITAVAFSPDSTILASASNTGLAVWLWRVADGEPILLIPDALDNCIVTGLAFHPQGRLLAVGGIDWMATGGSDGAVSVWDLVERCEVATLFGGSTAIAMHSDGNLLASASLEHTIALCNPLTQDIVAELTGHDATINSLAFSPDGRLLASGSDDRTLRLWTNDGDDAGLVELDSQVKALAFSADGRSLFTANGNTTCSQFDLKRIL